MLELEETQSERRQGKWRAAVRTGANKTDSTGSTNRSQGVEPHSTRDTAVGADLALRRTPGPIIRGVRLMLKRLRPKGRRSGEFLSVLPGSRDSELGDSPRTAAAIDQPSKVKRYPKIGRQWS
jgi:hypothetical protein